MRPPLLHGCFFFLIAIELKCIILVENTADYILNVLCLTTHLNFLGDHVFPVQRFFSVLYFSVCCSFLLWSYSHNVIAGTKTKRVVP